MLKRVSAPPLSVISTRSIIVASSAIFHAPDPLAAAREIRDAVS